MAAQKKKKKKPRRFHIICKTLFRVNRYSQLLLAVFIPLCFLLPHCVQPFKHHLPKSWLPNIKWFLWGQLWKRRNFESFISCATVFFTFWLSCLTRNDTNIQAFIPSALIKGDIVEGFNILNALLCCWNVTGGPLTSNVLAATSPAWCLASRPPVFCCLFCPSNHSTKVSP